MSQWHLAPPFHPRSTTPRQIQHPVNNIPPATNNMSSPVQQAQQPDDVQQQQRTPRSIGVVPQRQRLSFDAAPWYPRRAVRQTEQPSTAEQQSEQQTERRSRWRLSTLPNLMDVLLAEDEALADQLITQAEQDELHDSDYADWTGTLGLPVNDRLALISQWDRLLTRVNRTLLFPDDEDDIEDGAVKGLTSQEMSRLRTYRFQPTETTDDRDECSCCLGEFEAEEMLRVLPCKHEFHSACVDRWLRDHRTCPLCRANAA